MQELALIVILLGAVVMFSPKLPMWYPTAFKVDTTDENWKDKYYFYMFITTVIGMGIWTAGLLILFVFGLFK